MWQKYSLNKTQGWIASLNENLRLNGTGASIESVVVFSAGLFAWHYAVDLAKFRWQSLLLREFILEERHRQLFVVLHRVQVELVKRVVGVEFFCV